MHTDTRTQHPTPTNKDVLPLCPVPALTPAPNAAQQSDSANTGSMKTDNNMPANSLVKPDITQSSSVHWTHK